MLKISTILISLICATSSLAHAVEYKDGWDYMKFYKAVQNCRELMVYPQIEQYEQKGIKNNHDLKDLHNELISVTPIFDNMTTNLCFCTLNEVAKDNTYSQYKKGVDYESYMKIPRCGKVLEESLNSMEEVAKALRLN